jgi:hypothetical protein
MKQKFILITASFIAASFLVFLHSTHSGQKTVSNKNMGAPTSVEGERGSSFYEYELIRLRDPASGKIPANIRQLELEYASTLPNDANIANNRFLPQAVWNQRGPWNLGGRTRAFGIDAANENNLIAGSASGGMWRSTNDGQTWQRTFANNQWLSITCLAQDKRVGKQNKWFAGSGEAYGASASATGAYYLGDGLWTSADSGVTWTKIAATSSNSPYIFNSEWDIIWNVAVDNSETVNDELYVARYGSIMRSTNGGTSWTMVRGATGNNTSYFTDVAVTSTGVVYATLSYDGTHAGIWRSADGTTWTNITPQTFPDSMNRVVIAICPTDENQIWFLGNTPGDGQPDTNFVGAVEWNSLWKYTFLSGDGDSSGGYWQNKSAALPTTGGLFDKFSAQGSYNLVVAVHPSDTNIVFIGGTNLYRSTNGFADDSQTTFIGGYQQGATLPIVNMYANHHPDQHVLMFKPSNNNIMYSITDGGIHKTTNCLAPTVSYQSLNDGYITSMFYTVAIDHAGTNNVIVAGAQDNGSWFTNSANLQTPWVTPRGGDGSYCAVANNLAMYYLSIQNGKMMKAQLGVNGNLQNYARIDPIGASGYLFINPYIIDGNNNNVMYLAGGSFVWRNNDLSQIPLINNWDTISTNWVRLPDSLTAGAKVSALSVSKTPANRLYYGTTNGKLYRIDNAHTGTPTPTNVTSTTPSHIFPNGSNISSVAVNPNNADEVMVTFSNYSTQSVFYSASGGLPANTSWSRVGGNLEPSNGSGPSVRGAAIIPVSDGKVYMVATSVGLFATDTLKGINTVWVQQGANTIGNSVCNMIDFRTTDGLVVVATHSNGIFSTYITSVADIVTIKEYEKFGNQLGLTNFPNPVYDQATIEFNLPAKTTVTLHIIDISGKITATPINAQAMLSGKQQVLFNREKFAAGIYIIRLSAGEITETKKMILK